MTSEAPLLSIRNLSRRHPDGRQWLLREVELTLSAGERVVILGPTGAGKTLLLRAVALLDATDSGEVLWRGEPIAETQIPSFRSRVIYLHQRPAFAEGTVEESLQSPFELQSHRQSQYDRQKVLRLLEPLKLGSDFLKKSHDELSGGEAQIVALARAVQLEPHVLLLDEPTAALDPRTADAVEALVQQWLDADRQSRALLWITHDERLASRVADRTLVMKAGVLETRRLGEGD